MPKPKKQQIRLNIVCHADFDLDELDRLSDFKEMITEQGSIDNETVEVIDE